MNKKNNNGATNGYPQMRLNVLRGAIRVVSVITPALAARWIYYLWFKTYRHNAPPREREWSKNAQRHTIDTRQGRLSALVWGPPQPRRVLMVHGWNGRATQMGAFAQPLVARDYQVWALDLPGHGESSGTSSNLLIAAQSIHDAHQAWGPFYAVVGHSFGASANLLALHQGLSVQRAISISQPPNIRWLLEFYCRMIGATPTVEKRVMQRIEKYFGAQVWGLLDMQALAKTVDTTALIIHDENDKEVPLKYGQVLADAWRNARLLTTQGLGHYRVLRAPRVIEAVCQFLNRDTPTN